MNRNINPITAENLIKKLAEEYLLENYNPLLVIENVAPVLQADGASLVFIDSKRKDKIELLQKTQSKIIICDIKDENSPNKTRIITKNPRLTFVRLLTEITEKKETSGIHPSAVIHPEAIIHHSAYIGPNTYIGKSLIEKNVFIHGNCFLYDNVTIGSNVVINAGCTIGAEGFGYLKESENNYINFPHIGGVIVEDNVEIGCNTCIDRGALGNTIIRKGVKIDNLVHIAHNVVIGENSLIIANAMIGGSTQIGANTWIAPSSSLRDVISIGENAIVGMGAVVTKSIPSDVIYAGNPATDIELQKNIQKFLREQIKNNF